MIELVVSAFGAILGMAVIIAVATAARGRTLGPSLYREPVIRPTLQQAAPTRGGSRTVAFKIDIGERMFNRRRKRPADPGPAVAVLERPIAAQIRNSIGAAPMPDVTTHRRPVCPQCGHLVTLGAAFCRGCGHQLAGGGR